MTDEDSNTAFAAGVATATAEQAEEAADEAAATAEQAEETAGVAVDIAVSANENAWDARFAVDQLRDDLDGRLNRIEEALTAATPPAETGPPAPEKREPEPEKEPKGDDADKGDDDADADKPKGYGHKGWFGN